MGRWWAVGGLVFLVGLACDGRPLRYGDGDQVGCPGGVLPLEVAMDVGAAMGVRVDVALSLGEDLMHAISVKHSPGQAYQRIDVPLPAGAMPGSMLRIAVYSWDAQDQSLGFRFTRVQLSDACLTVDVALEERAQYQFLEVPGNLRACIQERLRDADPSTPAFDPDCRANDGPTDHDFEPTGPDIPACAGSGGGAACWRLTSNLPSCPSGWFSFSIDRGGAPPSGRWISFSCADCPAGLQVPGCP